ncbi:MAG TPA: hypothetical protein VFR22_05060 [Nocardioidaceae bacterium]|nr:hypothetical protein [Nocardioidaceae bacterium]
MVAAEATYGPTVPHVLVVAIGMVLLALSIWAWRGRSRRSRWWVGSPYGGQVMLGLVPGLGLIILSMGLLTLIGPWFTAVAGLPILFGAALVLAVIFARLPRWWGPGWYREMSEAERRADLTNAFAAAVVGLTDRPGVVSAKDAADRYRGDRPLGSWRGGWVHDPDTDERAHGMSRKGTIDGRLTLYPSGLVFAASRAEDALRRKGTVIAIDTHDIVDVRVVPARAGADGRPRSGVLYRSWFPRLVVETPDVEQVFDVAWGRARQVRDRCAGVVPERR